MTGQLVPLSFPMLGLDRSGSLQRQPPNTTMGALNVRPLADPGRRFRGGTRGGVDRCFRFADGDVASPIQLLNTIAFANSKGWDSWGDDFHGDTGALGGSWDLTPAWGSGWDEPEIVDRRLEITNPDKFAAILSPTGDAAVYDSFVAGQDFVVRIWVTPHADTHHGTYRIYLRLDDVTPDAEEDGVVVSLTMVEAGGVVSVAGSIVEYDAGSPTTTNFDAQANQTAAAGWLEVYVKETADPVEIKAYWRGALLKSTTLAATPAGRLVGFGAEPAGTGDICRIDAFQLHFLNTANLTSRRIMLAARDGTLYREEFPGHFVEVDDTLSTQESIASAEFFQNLLIADCGQPIYDSANLVVSDNGYTLSVDLDMPMADWPDFSDMGVDPEKHVVEIEALPGNTTTQNGTYVISSIEPPDEFDDLPAKIRLRRTAGGDGKVKARIVIAPKRYFYGSGGDTAAVKRNGTGHLEGEDDEGKIMRDYNVDAWSDHGVDPDTDELTITRDDSEGQPLGTYDIEATRDQEIIHDDIDGVILSNGIILVAESLTADVTDLMTQDDEIAAVGRDVVDIGQKNAVLHDVADNGRISADGTRMYSTSQDSTDWTDVVPSTDAIRFHEFVDDPTRDYSRRIAGMAAGEFQYARLIGCTLVGTDGITIPGWDHDDFLAHLSAGVDKVRFSASNGGVTTYETYDLHATQFWGDSGSQYYDAVRLDGLTALPAGLAYAYLYSPDKDLILFSPPIRWNDGQFPQRYLRECSYIINSRSAGVTTGVFPIEGIEEYSAVGTGDDPILNGATASNVLSTVDIADWNATDVVADAAYVRFTAGTNSPNEFKVVAVATGGLTLDGSPSDATGQSFYVYYPKALRLAAEAAPASAAGTRWAVTYRIRKPAQLYLNHPWPPKRGTGLAEGLVDYRIATAAEQIGHQLELWTTERNEDGTYKGQVPTLCELIAVFQDRVVLAAPLDFPHLYYASRQGNDRDFDYSQLSDADPSSAAAGTTVYGGRLADAIHALIVHPGDYLIFGCEHSMHVMRGDPGLLAPLDMLTPATGIVDRDAWCHDDRGRLWFLGHDGLYVMAGPQSPEPVSQNRIPAELRGLSKKTHRVQMGFDEQYRGVWIFVRAKGGADRYCYWFDTIGGGFWPMSLPEGVMPTSIFGRTRDQLTAPGMILGGKDGVIRSFDRSHVRDGGTVIPWHYWLGPFRTSGDTINEGMVLSLQGTVAKPGGPAKWSLHGGQDSEEVMSATAFMKGTWLAGRNLQNNPRMKAGAFGVKVYGDSIGEHASFETASARVMPLTRQRRTGV